MLLRLFTFLIISLTATSLHAAVLTADIAPKQLSIGGIFGGTTLTVFGLQPEGGELIAILEGPSGPFVVHKKEKQLFFWINGPSKKLSDVPKFYQLAATAAPEEILDIEKRTTHHIGMESLFEKNDGQNKYTDAFVRLKEKMGHYTTTQAAPERHADGTYRVDFTIPSNVPTGDYIVKVFHIRENNIEASVEKSYAILETGFTQRMNELIRGNSLIFSFFALASALALGLLGALMMPRR